MVREVASHSLPLSHTQEAVYGNARFTFFFSLSTAYGNGPKHFWQIHLMCAFFLAMDYYQRARKVNAVCDYNGRCFVVVVD